jgi:hypothetical protein
MVVGAAAARPAAPADTVADCFKNSRRFIVRRLLFDGLAGANEQGDWTLILRARIRWFSFLCPSNDLCVTPPPSANPEDSELGGGENVGPKGRQLLGFHARRWAQANSLRHFPFRNSLKPHRDDFWVAMRGQGPVL